MDASANKINIIGMGYTEMYEWQNKPEHDNRFGKFVTFSKEDPEKIVLYGNSKNDYILGVSTITSACNSDDPEEWQGKWIINGVGDVIVSKERLAVGTKRYDENTEISFIQTYPWEHYIKQRNEDFDEEANYIPRSNRIEWVRVNLLGKVIVYDNGKCEAGKLCKPYTGKQKAKHGIAIPANDDDKNTFYVLERLTENTILIINK